MKQGERICIILIGIGALLMHFGDSKRIEALEHRPKIIYWHDAAGRSGWFDPSSSGLTQEEAMKAMHEWNKQSVLDSLVVNRINQTNINSQINLTGSGLP